MAPASASGPTFIRLNPEILGGGSRRRTWRPCEASIGLGLAATSLDPSSSWTRRSSTSIPSGLWSRGTRRGLTAFSRAVEKVFEGLDAWEIEPEEFRTAGDQVVVVISYRARVHGSRADVEARESALWTFRDGKVVRYAWFHEPADALEAAGLSE